ncbi:DUF7261 family protein [Halorientalis pallida]|uniref:DUF7261 family protein n=1 Tax=Halorientalis pallida TaxID=2479928 RepID=UPI003C6ED00B
MVTLRDPERSDRAQLLLVGSLAIAVVVIGLAVVVNSVLLTENVARSESVGVADEATGFDAEAVRNVREIVLRLNHRSRLRTQDQISSRINSSIRNYSQLLAQTTVRDEGAWVNIEFADGRSTWGQRVVQVTDDGIVSPASTNSSDWRPVVNDRSDGDDNADIGRFVVNMNVTRSETNPMVVTVTNESTGYTTRIRVEKETNDSVLVDTVRNFAPDPPETSCSPTQDRLLVELKTGSAFNAECSFGGIVNTSDPSRTLEPPYGVQVEGGASVVGKFSLVMNRSVEYADDLSLTDFPYDDCTAPAPPVAPPGDDPCATPAVWIANATVTYQSDRIDYSRQHNVSIYP